jgi:HD-GYP domain-containing protein (c-di-GMP phosphodiesterase class II)
MTSPTTTEPRYSLADHAKALAVILGEEFGVPFAFHDAATGEVVAVPQAETRETAAPRWSPGVALQHARENRPVVAWSGDRATTGAGGRYELVLPLPVSGNAGLIAVGSLTALAHTPAEAAQEQARLGKWVQSFWDRLQNVNQAGAARGRQRADKGLDSQAAVAWETLLTLDHLIGRLRIHREPEHHQKRILRTAAEVLGAETVLWVPRDGLGAVLHQAESRLSPWDCSQLAVCLAESPDWSKSGLLLCNETSAAAWHQLFPHIKNLMALKAAEGDTPGWVIALNKKAVAPRSTEDRGPRTEDRESRDLSSVNLAPFRRSDATLLTPFVALLGLHLRSSTRYTDLKNLLVGLTRSLTAAIDAKDSYTFGHSERVARIAVELGSELKLDEEQLSDIYLAGLLHDIGKIGIPDAVLCKKEPLTPEEFEQIKQHVTIGYKILADLRPIRHLLVGVLYHHERYDGAGYPEGLKGESIPLLARILAVADSYDAMSTSRPYRDAMPCEVVEQVLEKGAGSQWDPRVIDAFRRCARKVRAVRQRGVGESLRHALDGALREGERMLESVASVGITP